MKKERLLTMVLTVLLACCSIPMRAQDEIIEHEGNKYIIHVELLNPDSEMTLMDVLHMCPELMSNDGKSITAAMAKASRPHISCLSMTSC